MEGCPVEKRRKGKIRRAGKMKKKLLFRSLIVVCDNSDF